MTARGILTSTAVAAAALTTTVLAAAPADAATARVDDPAGDVTGGPDITSVTVRNGDRAVRVVLQLDTWTRGITAVSVDPRIGRGLTLAERHAPGRTDSEVDAGAFSDRRGPSSPRSCDGFRVTRDRPAARVVFRMPSSCLHDGDYGALRFVAVGVTGRLRHLDVLPDQDLAVAAGFEGLAGSDWLPRG